MTCSECQNLVPRRKNGGYPKTCSARCQMARDRRRAVEVLNEQRADATRWWLALSQDARGAAMAFVATDPPPYNWRGGKQLWAYFNRTVFTCAGVVTSGVG